VTALVPLGVAGCGRGDEPANLRMIRRVAEVYGWAGRACFGVALDAGVLYIWLGRGPVAVGDRNMLDYLGGTMLAKLSRRFGEGWWNGALTAVFRCRREWRLRPDAVL